MNLRSLAAEMAAVAWDNEHPPTDRPHHNSYSWDRLMPSAQAHRIRHMEVALGHGLKRLAEHNASKGAKHA